MAEEENNSEELEENNNSEDGEDKEKTYTWEELHEVREEAKKHRTDKAKYRKDYEKVQAELKKLQDEKLSDSEKKDKKIVDLEKKIEDIQAKAEQKDIENLIVTTAAGKNFADIEVVKLLAQKELASEDDIDEKTVGKILDKIAKDKPYLIKSDKSATASSGNFGKTGMEGKKTGIDTLKTMLKNYGG